MKIRFGGTVILGHTHLLFLYLCCKQARRKEMENLKTGCNTMAGPTWKDPGPLRAFPRNNISLRLLLHLRGQEQTVNSSNGTFYVLLQNSAQVKDLAMFRAKLAEVPTFGGERHK